MTVGFTQTKDDINNRAGQLATQLRDTLAACVAFNGYLNDAATTDTFLAGVGIAGDDITRLRAAFVDAQKLSDIGHGQGVQAAPNDFFFNLRHLTGVV
jgi:hypothetical protein